MAWQQTQIPMYNEQGMPSSQIPMYKEHPASQSAGPGPFPNPLMYGAGSDILRTGIGAYGEKLFGTGRQYVESNINRYFSGQDIQYYFQVNDQYVKNKLKVILFPFLHRGHWTRISDQVTGGLAFRPPVFDINAPDLYIPLMAFGTFVVLCGIAFGIAGKFSPEAFSLQFTKGLLGWFLNAILIRLSLYALGNGGATILDVVSYAGYAFVGVSISIMARLVWHYSYYVVMPLTSLCMAIFLVKTMKRVVFAEVRSFERDSSKHHYLLLFMALAQFPLSFWLGYLRNT